MSDKRNTNNGKIGRVHGQYIADPTAQTITFEEIQAAMGLHGDRVRAEDLIGKTFDILRAKPYRSSFEGGGTVYFCVIRLLDDTEEKTVSLGGTAVVDAINEIVGIGFVNPLRVTLLRRDGDKDTDRYYYFG